MCSSCDELADFGLEELKWVYYNLFIINISQIISSPSRPHCKECCQRDQDSSVNRKYPKAVLEVCTCKFGAYPQIQAFIKSDRPAKFPNLHIKYVRGLDPTVKLMDKEGNVKETLNINKWNTDTVQEFFETHLENPNSQNGDDDEDYLKTNRVWWNKRLIN